jgi:hypothetical protein
LIPLQSFPRKLQTITHKKKQPPQQERLTIMPLTIRKAINQTMI